LQRRLVQPQVGGRLCRHQHAIQQQEQHQQQRPSPMEAIAAYVVEAWKMRSAALNGRGTNGGDPMVSSP
jgi:hypothetical protein